MPSDPPYTLDVNADSDLQLLELWDQRYSTLEIARYLAMAEHAVYNRLWRLRSLRRNLQN